MVYPLPKNNRGRPHESAEAFCVMLYRAENGEERWVWNSRDGVTPFQITIPGVGRAVHTDWKRDRYEPNYVPEVGSLIFVDYDPESAKEAAEQLWERWKNEPNILQVYESKERFLLEKAWDILTGFWPHPPRTVTVTEEIRAKFIPKGLPN